MAISGAVRWSFACIVALLLALILAAADVSRALVVVVLCVSLALGAVAALTSASAAGVIKRAEEAARAISAGNLRARMRARREGDGERLSDAFNEMPPPSN